MVGINTNRINKQAFNKNILYQLYGSNPYINYQLSLGEIDTKTNTILVKGLDALYLYGLSVLGKTVGNPISYTSTEAKQRINKRRRIKYATKVKQYKKDIDKSLCPINKKDVVKASKDFYSSHYQFNFFISLQHGFVLDKADKNVCKTSEDYQTIKQQDKYQIAKVYSQQQCLDEAVAYVKRLTKHGKQIYDNYYIAIHKSHYDNSYHAHIAINITNQTIKNVHTYLQNRWYKSQRKKQMVKKIHNKAELIGYMNEEKKRLHAHTVMIECNIDKHSDRLFNQDDLTIDLDYSLKTYKHPDTISRLKQFAKAS